MSRVGGGWATLLAVIVSLAVGLAGCATPVERLAVPAALASEASVPGMGEIRLWGDAPSRRHCSNPTFPC
jgi:hypothetical protein